MAPSEILNIYKNNIDVMIMIVASGSLEPGVHKAQWDEPSARFGTNDHRRNMLAGLRKAAANLQAAGCKTIYVDGSFVTTKLEPNDYDAVWDINGVDIGMLDDVFFKLDDGRKEQKSKYLGEFFPSDVETGERTVMLDFFQTEKETGDRKGIVAVSLGGDLG